jgi:hypothetical protein
MERSLFKTFRDLIQSNMPKHSVISRPNILFIEVVDSSLFASNYVDSQTLVPGGKLYRSFGYRVKEKFKTRRSHHQNH